MVSLDETIKLDNVNQFFNLVRRVGTNRYNFKFVTDSYNKITDFLH